MVSRPGSHHTGPHSPAPVSARAMPPATPSPHLRPHSRHGHHSDHEHSHDRTSDDHGHHHSGSHEPSSHHHHHSSRHVHRHVHGGHHRGSQGPEEPPISPMGNSPMNGMMPYGQSRYPPTFGDPLRGAYQPQAGYFPPMGSGMGSYGAYGPPMYPGAQAYGDPMMMGGAGYPMMGRPGFGPGYAPPYGAASLMDPYYPGGAGGAYGRPPMGPMTGARTEMMMNSMHSPMHGQAMPGMSVDYAERLNGEPLVPGTHQYEMALRYGAQMDPGLYPRRF